MAASVEACPSYDLGLSDAVPYAVHLRLPASVREAIEKAQKKSLSVSLRFGSDFSNGTLCVGGQDFGFWSVASMGQTKLVQRPCGPSGQAGEVAVVHQKCQVHVVDTAAGGKAKAPKGPKSKTGMALAAKAAAANQQFEEDKRKKAAERRLQGQAEASTGAVAGKTTAPEKMKLAFNSKNPNKALPSVPLPGKGALSQPSGGRDGKEKGGKEKSTVMVPNAPTKAMIEAAKQDGMRGCIIALMYPPGMKVKNPKIVERLVKETLMQIGTPQQRLPSQANVSSELKKLTTYQAPAAYVLKDEYREEYEQRAAQAAVKSSSAELLGRAVLMGGEAREHSGSPQLDTAKEEQAAHDPGRITKRKRVISSNGKTQVWAPNGDAAHRLAAVPSTAAAERAEREAREAVLRERGGVDRGQPEQLLAHDVVGGGALGSTTPTGATKPGMHVADSPALQHATVTCELASENGGRKPQAVEEPPPAAASTQVHVSRETVRDGHRNKDGKRAGEGENAEQKWFFLEHFNRSRKTYDDVTSENQAAEYETEYKSKYSVLLELYKKINVYKEEVKALSEEGSAAESSIRRIWDDEREYLLGMDAAFKLLKKELNEMKAKAKVFWKSRKADLKRKREN